MGKSLHPMSSNDVRGFTAHGTQMFLLQNKDTKRVCLYFHGELVAKWHYMAI